MILSVGVLEQLQKKPPCYEEINAALEEKPATMSSHLISSSGTGSNIQADDRNSDTFDDKVLLEDLRNTLNIPISTNKKSLAGSSRQLTGEQNESSLSNKNAGDENSLGNENFGN